MASWNGYFRALADGEVSTFAEYFWHFIGMNRRDHDGFEPIRLWVWDEEAESKKVQDAQDKLLAALKKNDWSKEYAEYLKPEPWRAEAEERSEKEMARVKAVQAELIAIMKKGVPEVMQEFHDNHLGYFKEALEWNEGTPPYQEPDKSPLDEFILIHTKMHEQGLERAKTKYQERKDRVEKTRAFIAAAIEMYGEPPMGIKKIPSTEMY